MTHEDSETALCGSAAATLRAVGGGRGLLPPPALPSVVHLQHGHNVIGRGAPGWPGLRDRRISRRHASVSWAAGAAAFDALALDVPALEQQHVWIESTGTNPMQVRRAFGTTIQLKHGDAASLRHGDIVELLPGLFPFRIEFHELRNAADCKTTTTTTTSTPTPTTEDENKSSCKRQRLQGTGTEGNDTRRLSEDCIAGYFVEDSPRCTDAHLERAACGLEQIAAGGRVQSIVEVPARLAPRAVRKSSRTLRARAVWC